MSQNIIEASTRALVDSLEFFLLRRAAARGAGADRPKKPAKSPA